MIPTVRPSWLTALARITARMRSPSARASSSRLRTTAAAPSPELIPSAAASNVRVWWWAERIPNSSSGPGPRGAMLTLTLPTTAIRICPLRSASEAMWTATRLDEQAVSTTTQGPRRSR